MKGGKRSQWGFPFFGLAETYKIRLHELIFDMVHYGHFDYWSVYDMPVQYRTFYIKKLLNIKENENRQKDVQNGLHEGESSSELPRGPDIHKKPKKK